MSQCIITAIPIANRAAHLVAPSSLRLCKVAVSLQKCLVQLLLSTHILWVSHDLLLPVIISFRFEVFRF